jgi:putative hemolysin
MLARQPQQEFGTPGRLLSVALARNVHEVREAQRLRYQVFTRELGARVPGREQGIDCDIYDAYCDHLLVRDTVTNEVVGTYRILSGAKARRIGGFYADGEFDLSRLNHLRDSMLEVGRSCVHPDYRNGAAIALLWSGLGEYALARRFQFLIGCASISVADGGRGAAGIFRRLRETSLSPVEYRVFPRSALPLDGMDPDPDVPVPALVKGYIRLGAYICGAPARDPNFNAADLLMLLPLARVTPRYARHFLKGAES